MIRVLAALALAALVAGCSAVPPASASASAPATATATAAEERDGRFIEWNNLAADGLPAQRVTIWLPPQYFTHPEQRFPVLYMWDGQNLFDPAKTHYGKAWMVQKVLGSMLSTPSHIVVGVWSPPGKDRYRVYVPQFAENARGPLAADIARMAGGPIASKRQLDWVADSLKARVDAAYRTRPAPADTTIAGASMGGVMACYAAIERPDVFGRAGCVSAHLALADPELAPGHAAEIEALWASYLDAKLGAPNGRRLWIDHGTVGLDGFYGPWQQMLDRQLAARGWHKGADYTTQVFQQAEHDETFWKRRMPDMLIWLWRRN